jgi:hypothetical protein
MGYGCQVAYKAQNKITAAAIKNYSPMRLDLPGITGSGELYLDVVRAICGNDTADKSMVDLGAHKSPYNSQLNFAYKQYVDIQDRPLDDISQQQYLIKEDVLTYLNKVGWKFTVAIASDLIEHLTIEKGNELICLMKERSFKQIIFTPLGEFNLTKDDNPDSHRSGWTPEMLPGFAAIVLPDFHPALNIGAFFAWNCKNIEQEFERVCNELKNKSWIKYLSLSQP